MCADVFDGIQDERALDVVVGLADVAALLAEGEDADNVESEPIPFAANSDFTRLRCVKSG